MTTRRFNSKCVKCGRVFSNESSDLDVCHPCLQALLAQKDKEPNHTCKSCGERHYSPNHMKKCQCCMNTQYSGASRPPKTYDNTKPTKKHSCGHVSIEELNRRLEHKRVWDDKGWDHYLKGRKWDRI